MLTDYRPEILLVRVVLFREFNPPKFLVVQRGNGNESGLWCLPGGKKEFGESALDAMDREIWEEIGLLPSKYSFFSASFPKERVNGEKADYATMNFFGKVKPEAKVKIDGIEVVATKLITIDDALNGTEFAFRNGMELKEILGMIKYSQGTASPILSSNFYK
jgi:8-oxo-dGTP pyrophosphatase MutT (NUDIX family)